MKGDLSIPQVPAAKPQDPEDVSWALSTAEAMWARGDHAEGIKWVRRAAEAASEAEDDARALALAKAAADLAALIARRSKVESSEAIELEEVAEPAVPPAPPTKPGMPAPKVPAARAATSASVPPRPLVTPSRAPAPMPSRTPAAPLASKRGAAGEKAANAKPGAPTPLRAASPGKKSSRRSRENLDAEARAALKAAPDTSKLVTLDSASDLSETAETVAVRVPYRRRSRPDVDRSDIEPADDWGEAETTANADALGPKGPPATVRGSVKAPPAAKPAGIGASFAAKAAAKHDPGITTSQAVRVVVWRDASGVHVAPSGTVVSAITIEAVLVALEPGADLTAWLSGDAGPKQRR